ncbi:hypothetical protein CEXT_91421 [Caerostris extrusa]|uniref:Uncharacterized protein n=1 Tax=Caerostris extrusa TaxID=172846 RepID=A0AAV4VWB1_CAEEX|nr:hypothetical protein CEXT_91421 [Caerostris extrusa]
MHSTPSRQRTACFRASLSLSRENVWQQCTACFPPCKRFRDFGTFDRPVGGWLAFDLSSMEGRGPLILEDPPRSLLKGKWARSRSGNRWEITFASSWRA